jgi:hypothetical protein
MKGNRETGEKLRETGDNRKPVGKWVVGKWVGKMGRSGKWVGKMGQPELSDFSDSPGWLLAL